jgi:hypothetical protein
MAQHDAINNSMLQTIINSIPSKHFTTLSVVSALEINYKNKVEELKGYSPRNYRSVIGKAVKRFSVETNKIKQISPPDESPARWEKV